MELVLWGSYVIRLETGGNSKSENILLFTFISKNYNDTDNAGYLFSYLISYVLHDQK